MQAFSIDCRRCPRLARHLDQVRQEYPHYHSRPVAAFGPARARLLIVGLAPGMQGANRTGRPFTGDIASILLYETLHRYGYASRPLSVSATDGLRLRDCRITFDSYHCSRYNTQTRRLTPEMFRSVLDAIRGHLKRRSHGRPGNGRRVR